MDCAVPLLSGVEGCVSEYAGQYTNEYAGQHTNEYAG